jgi:hypothetical protein
MDVRGHQPKPKVRIMFLFFKSAECLILGYVTP